MLSCVDSCQTMARYSRGGWAARGYGRLAVVVDMQRESTEEAARKEDPNSDPGGFNSHNSRSVISLVMSPGEEGVLCRTAAHRVTRVGCWTGVPEAYQDLASALERLLMETRKRFREQPTSPPSPTSSNTAPLISSCSSQYSTPARESAAITTSAIHTASAPPKHLLKYLHRRRLLTATLTAPPRLRGLALLTARDETTRHNGLAATTCDAAHKLRLIVHNSIAPLVRSVPRSIQYGLANVARSA